MIKLVIARIFKNLAGMSLNKFVILWGLKLAAKKTENLVDDNLILLAESAYDNDVEGVKKASKAITDIYLPDEPNEESRATDA
jgi:hypothetical protein